jgi:hypothetical protein
LREDRADNKGDRRIQASQPQKRRHGSRGQCNLRGTQAEDLMTHRMQLRQRVVQADREQEKDHAELGQDLELRDMHRRACGVGPQDQSDQQVSQAGRDVQALKADHHHHGDGQQQDDLNQMIHKICQIMVDVFAGRCSIGCGFGEPADALCVSPGFARRARGRSARCLLGPGHALGIAEYPAHRGRHPCPPLTLSRRRWGGTTPAWLRWP